MNIQWLMFMILITVNCCHLDQHGDNHLIVTPYRAKHDVISQYMSYAWLSPQHVDFVYNLVVIQVPHTVHEALQISWWIEAMNVEMTTLEKIPCRKLYLLLNIRNVSVIDECSLLNIILVVSWSTIKHFQY